MHSLLQIFRNKYIQIILFLVFFYVLTHTFYNQLGSISFPVIVFLLFLDDINNDTIIPISVILGVFADFVLNTYFGIGVLLFLGLGMMKIYGEYKVEFKNYIAIIVFSVITIVVYNVYYAFILGFNFFASFGFISIRILIDVVSFLILFFLVRFIGAIFSFKG